MTLYKEKQMLNAWKISAELEKRHTNDMFFTEVKNGPTWFGGHKRIDAIAIKKSWANPCIVGYEIKVSRHDFVQDNKWQAYLDMCNELYFVCPKDLIALNEVPEPCGLRYMYDTGHMKIVKKAPYRQIEHPAEMYLYLLMKYAQSAKPPFRQNRYEQIEAFIEDRVRAEELSRKFHSKLLDKIVEYEKEKERECYSQRAWQKDKREYDKIVELLRQYTGNKYLAYPSIVMEKILAGESERAKRMLVDLENMVRIFKESNGLSDKERDDDAKDFR